MALAPSPLTPSYAISKAASFNMTQSLRALLASQGVRVHAVLTGPTDIEMTRGFEIPKASPEAVARAILDGKEFGEEDIFPDPMSASISESWRSGAVKANGTGERRLRGTTASQRIIPNGHVVSDGPHRPVCCSPGCQGQRTTGLERHVLSNGQRIRVADSTARRGILRLVTPSAASGSRTHMTANMRQAQPKAMTEQIRRRTMSDHKIGTREQWLSASADLLEREKQLSRLEDDLAQRRRDLPWVPVEKQYSLQTRDGAKSLPELFDGRTQLVVYHFMFGPSYAAGCPTNSSIADSINGLLPHLKARDVTMICVSGAPLEKLLAYQQRMGWGFTWASSYQSDFNYDFGVSSTEEATREWVTPLLEGGLPPIASQNAKASGTDVVSYIAEGFGFNAFARESDTVYHTYSCASRGVEFLMGYYPILDRTPMGRDEGDGFQTWLRRHDEYVVE
jgi:predicted dithiol-disulfide oxidoreductase (DUF899 family)